MPSIYAWHMPSICLVYAWHMPGICQAYAKHLPSIYLAGMCRRMPGICQAPDWHMPGTCVACLAHATTCPAKTKEKEHFQARQQMRNSQRFRRAQPKSCHGGPWAVFEGLDGVCRTLTSPLYRQTSNQSCKRPFYTKFSARIGGRLGPNCFGSIRKHCTGAVFSTERSKSLLERALRPLSARNHCSSVL